ERRQLGEYELSAAREREDPKRAVDLPREPDLPKRRRRAAARAAAPAEGQGPGAADRRRAPGGRGQRGRRAPRASARAEALEGGESARPPGLHERAERAHRAPDVDRRKRRAEPPSDRGAARPTDGPRLADHRTLTSRRRADHDHEGDPARRRAEDGEGHPRPQLLSLLP